MAKITKIEEVEGAPALYAKSIQVEGSFEEYTFHITTGLSILQLVLSPGHAKRLALVIQGSILEYERTFGEINTAPVNASQTTSKDKGIGFGEKEV